jgi:hypothetical protein
VLIDMFVGGMMGERMRKLRDLATNPPPVPETAAAGDQPAEAPPKRKRMTIADRIAEGVKRDLEKMERERAEKEAKQKPPDDA